MIYNLANEYQRKCAQNRLDALIKQGAVVDIKLHKEKRSGAQNRYYHKVIQIIADELGYTHAEMQIVFKREFGMYYEKNGKQFVRSTTELDTGEMTKHIDDIRNWAAREGYYIESPEEFYRGLEAA